MKNPDAVWEDLMKYKIFNTKQITLGEYDDLRAAFNEDKDTRKTVGAGTIRNLSRADKVKEIAEENRLTIAEDIREKIKGVRKLDEAKRILEESKPLEEDIFERASKETESTKIFTSARRELEARQIGSVRALQEGREPALEVKRAERRKIFFDEIDSSEDIRIKGKRNVSRFIEVYDVTEREAIEKLRDLGLNVTDEGKILR